MAWCGFDVERRRNSTSGSGWSRRGSKRRGSRKDETATTQMEEEDENEVGTTTIVPVFEPAGKGTRASREHQRTGARSRGLGKAAAVLGLLSGEEDERSEYGGDDEMEKGFGLVNSEEMA